MVELKVTTDMELESQCWGSCTTKVTSAVTLCLVCGWSLGTLSLHQSDDMVALGK